MARYAIERIEDAARLLELRGAWSSLFERAPRATPFQSPEWLLAWWRHFAPGRLSVVALWDGERLAGLAPLFVEERAAGGPRLALIGTGISDYLGFLLDGDDEREAARALLHAVRSSRGPWAACELDQLPPDDPLLAAVGEDEPGTGSPGTMTIARVHVTHHDACWVLTLPRSVAAYEAGLPPRLRSRLRGRYRRRLDEVGAGPLVLADEATLPEFMDALFTLHEARRRDRGLPGALRDRALQAFHRELAARFHERGWLRLYGLFAGGPLAAVLYALHFRGRAYAYLSGFDPEFAPYSPGTVMIDGAIRDAITQGLAEFDFLRGREPYKRTWGATERVNMRVVMT